MTFVFYWQYELAYFLESFLQFTSLQNSHSQVTFEAKNDLVKVGV